MLVAVEMIFIGGGDEYDVWKSIGGYEDGHYIGSGPITGVGCCGNDFYWGG